MTQLKQGDSIISNDQAGERRSGIERRKYTFININATAFPNQRLGVERRLSKVSYTL